MALYRKYRPASFAEVIGQEHVTEPLSIALDAGRVNHAYLFSGPRGCGKTSSARILARSLNCLQGPTSTPCGVCDSCVGLGPGGGGTFDVTELDAASHGGVDDTRELRDHAGFSPASSLYRIFIIDEAHMVTTAGFNALLKIVEEPPEHVVFIFATTEPEKVLPTIRSRTHHYPFRLLPPATMRGLLERICEQESVSVEPAVYPLVIRAGGGSPRDSLSVLDQLLAGAGPEGVTYARALSLLGVTDVALIDDAVDALAAADGAALFGTVDRLMDAGHDPRRFAIDLLDRIRDLILLRAVPDAGERGLVDAPGDVLERMSDEAQRVGPATLARYAEVVHAGLGEMRGATAPRLLLEVVCARLLLPAASDAESAVLQRLERVERRLTITPPSDEATGQFRRSAERAGTVPAGDTAPRPAAPATDEATIPAPSTSRPAATVSAEPGTEEKAPPIPADRGPVAHPDDDEAPGPNPVEDVAPRAAAQPEPVRATVADPTAPAAPAPPAPAPAPAATDQVSTPAATAQVPTPAATDPTAPPAPAAPAPLAPETGAEPPPEPVRQPATAQPDAAAVRRVWPEVRNKVRERSRTTEVMLSAATVRRVDGDTLVLSHDSGPLAKRLTESRNADVVREALRDVLGVDWTVVCESGSGEPAAAPLPAPVRPAPASGGQRFTRPQRTGAPAAAPSHAVDDVPPPDEPADPDDPEPDAPAPDAPDASGAPGAPAAPAADAPAADDEEALLAEAASGAPVDASVRRDPEELALELLVTELGARPLERGR